MSRFSKTCARGSPVPWRAASTMALAKSSAPDHLVGEQHPKHRVDRAQQAIAEIRLLPRRHRIDVCRAKEIDLRETGRAQRVLGLSLVAFEGHPTPSRRICATPAQECERRVGTAAAENSRECDRVVHGYRAELCVRYRPGVCAHAKDRCMLIREHLRECRAVGEVLMENLLQLGMRDPDLPAPYGSHMSNGGVIENVVERVSTDHSRRAYDREVLLANRRNVPSRLRGVHGS